MKDERLLWISGLCWLLLPGLGWSLQPSHFGCPPLPAPGVAGEVSVSAGPAQATAGLVCVRVINGSSDMLIYGISLGRLQQWEAGEQGSPGQFRDYQDVSRLPDGTAVGSLLGGVFFPAGESREGVLPVSGVPAPAGRYRVCFRYSVVRQGEQSEHEVCSEEFSLP